MTDRQEQERFNLFKKCGYDIPKARNFIHYADHPGKCIRQMVRVTKEKMVIVDINQKGQRIMEKVHALDVHSHALSKMSVLGVKDYLHKAGLVVKVYRDVCQTVIIAKKGVLK